MIKRIPVYLEVYKFIITFTYDTRKGYYREQKRTIQALDEDNAISMFKDWSRQQRTMFNAKILSIVKTNNIKTIEL